jgi:hypothetical protein
MQALTQNEIREVSGGNLAAAVDGVIDGALTGALLAGKSAGAGGFIAGAVGQLVGAGIGGVAGAVGVGLYGLGHTREEVAAYTENFRETVGSAATAVGGSL